MLTVPEPALSDKALATLARMRKAAPELTLSAIATECLDSLLSDCADDYKLFPVMLADCKARLPQTELLSVGAQHLSRSTELERAAAPSIAIDPKVVKTLELIAEREGKNIADLVAEAFGLSLICANEKTARRLKEIADAAEAEPAVMLDHLLILPQLERSEGELIGWFEALTPTF
jgi:hypothetical protein